MIPKITNPVIVQRVSITDTLKEIEPGTAAVFCCKDVGAASSVWGVASKLNKLAGWKEYAVESDDNGITVQVTRYEKGGKS